MTEVLSKEVATNDRSEYSSTLRQNILASTDQMLAGAKTEKTYRNPATGEITVLVSLNIENHVASTLNAVRTDLEALGGESDGAGEAPGARLKRLARDYVVLEKQMPRIASLKAIVRQGTPAYQHLDQVSREVVPRYGRVVKAVESMPIQVAVVGGAGQQGYADEGLSEPIAFQATVDGQPLEAVPVSFQLEHPSKAEITRASGTSDGSGRFTCNLVNLQITGDGENEVQGRIDYRQLGLDRFAAPRARTAYSMATIESARFAIVVIEDNTGTRVSESVVEGELEQAVQGFGGPARPHRAGAVRCEPRAGREGGLHVAATTARGQARVRDRRGTPGRSTRARRTSAAGRRPWPTRAAASGSSIFAAEIPSSP